MINLRTYMALYSKHFSYITTHIGTQGIIITSSFSYTLVNTPGTNLQGCNGGSFKKTKCCWEDHTNNKRLPTA